MGTGSRPGRSRTSTTPSTGIVRALERPESRGEVINLGGVETLTILELAQRCQESLDHSPAPLRANFITYESLPGNYQDVRHRVPDTTKAERLLGFKTSVDFAEGLARTVAWHRACRDLSTAVEG